MTCKHCDTREKHEKIFGKNPPKDPYQYLMHIADKCPCECTIRTAIKYMRAMGNNFEMHQMVTAQFMLIERCKDLGINKILKEIELEHLVGSS